MKSFAPKHGSLRGYSHLMFYLSVYGVFNTSCSDYIASNDKVISEYIGKDAEGSCRGLILVPVGTEGNHKNAYDDSRSPKRDLNSVPLAYEAAVLTTQQRRSAP
jgi:hypothetical protein